ncbi:MAG: Unknown protein [uncultured Sulfurovum sp.]|uniref:Uncharacterized protein n=1 Tax=uncultured Sulfurovum sp. TaxID=269237 RepID=A0A6S6TXJ6_9BACT|nr:MAG: Unknown protein [uncultured Sulfurovum sp.]
MTTAIVRGEEIDSEELLNLYLEKLRLLAKTSLEEKETLSVMEALKKSIIRLEGEMTGY